MIGPSLTREEWRWLGVSTLGAVLGAIASEGIRHGFDELRRVQAQRREQDAERAALRARIEAP